MNKPAGAAVITRPAGAFVRIALLLGYLFAFATIVSRGSFAGELKVLSANVFVGVLDDALCWTMHSATSIAHLDTKSFSAARSAPRHHSAAAKQLPIAQRRGSHGEGGRRCERAPLTCSSLPRSSPAVGQAGRTAAAQAGGTATAQAGRTTAA
jgi:hypothetical protein